MESVTQINEYVASFTVYNVVEAYLLVWKATSSDQFNRKILNWLKELEVDKTIAISCLTKSPDESLLIEYRVVNYDSIEVLGMEIVKGTALWSCN